MKTGAYRLSQFENIQAQSIQNAYSLNELNKFTGLVSSKSPLSAWTQKSDELSQFMNDTTFMRWRNLRTKWTHMSILPRSVLEGYNLTELIAYFLSQSKWHTCWMKARAILSEWTCPWSTPCEMRSKPIHPEWTLFAHSLFECIHATHWLSGWNIQSEWVLWAHALSQQSTITALMR